MTNENKNFLKMLVHPSWSQLQEYIDTLNDIISECDDDEEKEWLTVAIDGFNLVISNAQKVLDKENNNDL